MVRFPRRRWLLAGLAAASLVGSGVGCGDSGRDDKAAPSADATSDADSGSDGIGSAPGQDAGSDSGGAGAPGGDDATRPPPWPVGAGCLFENGSKAAFCDDFSEGPNAGGRGADLDEARWSVARVTGSGASDFTAFPSTPAAACKAGVDTLTPDHDILVCDAASGHAGQILMGMSAQNYALVSMRPRQPFDFAGRTGTVVLDVDALTEGGLSWWTSFFITEEPYSAANDMTQVTGMVPRRGIGVSFDGGCSPTGAATGGVGHIFTYADYAETAVYTGTTAGPCVQTTRGSPNHIEVRLSTTHVEVWMSDPTPDGGKTFPGFKLMASADIHLPFARGYVHYQQAERAPLKYKDEFHISPGYASSYWSGLGFDGPALGGDVGYQVPDALTMGPGSGATPPGGAPNLGYALLATSPPSTVTCCSGGARTPIAPFSLPGVDLRGVSSATLTFTGDFTFQGGATPTSVGLSYRLNGNAWRTIAMPDMNAATYCSTCPQPAGPGELPGVAFSAPVDLRDLATGTNTLEFGATGTWDGYPAVIGNIDLLTSK